MSERGTYSSRWGRPVYLLSSLLCVICLPLWLLGKIAGLWLVLAVLLRVLLIPLGSLVAASGIFGRVLLFGPTDKPLVALTFDDGPDPQTTPRVLAVLASHQVRATFFVIGERAARHPELLRQLVAAGHQVENHSHRHSWATAFGPTERLVRELSSAQQVIEQAGAPRPRYFRAPIGILSPPIVAAVRKLELQLVGWTAKARDGWASTTVSAAVSRLERSLRPGAILLLHDAGEPLTGQHAARATIAPEVLQQLLPRLRERGLSAVTLDELLRQ
jgi:peptidoglycan/xylan/chitin deacetylase (PgdA/CDA1 family)